MATDSGKVIHIVHNQIFQSTRLPIKCEYDSAMYEKLCRAILDIEHGNSDTLYPDVGRGFVYIYQSRKTVLSRKIKSTLACKSNLLNISQSN